MKKIIGIFIVALITVIIADLIQGVILTFIHTPNVYSTSNLEMANYIKYAVYASTLTIAFGCINKVKDKVKSTTKSSVKVS
ncbi:hypothetical protein MKX73_17120 [Solibacillus sp. FSL W7-1436]|uniref:hypothetical protein n=1 Tax=Solibacillus sp. FSL W7-1436 TaxID=2921705 RepID=UPI0030F5E98C